MRRTIGAGLALLLALLPSALRAQGDSARALTRALEQLDKAEGVRGLPPVDSITRGGRSVPAGTTVTGTIVATGPVEIAGIVVGSVVSLGGNVLVRRGGHVQGDVIAVGGIANADSGRVDGELRTMSALPTLLPADVAQATPPTLAERTYASARVVAGSFGVLLVIAIGVLLFAGHNLAEVVETVERRFARAFWVGLAAQLLILPGLVVLCVALALTLIGVLLVPFAVVAYAIAVAGLVTLGFLAVAQLIGSALWRSRGSDRSRAIASLAIGVALFFALWMVAALLAWAPLAATVVRASAVAASWAALTLGLGAAVLSRAGTHRRVSGGARAVELAAWQTPTPVAGVVAARRPVAAREAR